MEHGLDLALSTAAKGAQLQVLLHAHASQDGPTLRHLDNAAADDAVRRPAGDVVAMVDDVALLRPDQAGDCAE